MDSTVLAHRFCLIGLLLLAPLSARAQTTQPREIIADLAGPKTPRSMVYKACVGAGRVGEGLRGDWQRQLKECRDQIGFEQIRMHGLLHDELGVYSQKKDGTPRYNWQYIDAVYDYLLSIGVRPFVEIGFMPNDLASGSKNVFWWHANVTPPKDYARWDALITALVQHWTDRYGVDEVKQWNFEIWNEPNHPAFFGPKVAADRMQEYFELYDHTARAVTQVNPAYRVGGPATAGPAYISELIDHCAKNNVPLDFISFHSYGLRGGPGGFDAHGDSFTYLNPNPIGVAHTAASQFPIITKSAKPNLPVHITEWSASYSSRDPVHDHYFSAPYVLEQLRHAESLASMSYWTFTDIFEEAGIPPRPFHGGFGLMNLQGIKKPAFFAFQFMNRLGDQEVKTNDPRSYVTADSRGGFQVLAWDLTDILPAGVPNQNFFTKLQPAQSLPDLTIRLKHCAPGTYRMSVYRVGYEKNDAYSRYQEMGSPAELSLKEVAALKDAASGQAESEQEITVGSTGEFTHTLPMRTNDVYLVTLTPHQ